MIGSRFVLSMTLSLLAGSSCLDAQLTPDQRPSLDFSGKASNGAILKMTARCMGDASGTWFLDMEYVPPKPYAQWLLEPQRVLMGAPIMHGVQTPIYRTDYCPHAELTVNGDLSKNDDLTSVLCNRENIASFRFSQDYGEAIFKSSKTEFGIHLSDEQYTRTTIHPQSLQLTDLINTCEKLTDQAKEYDRTHPSVAAVFLGKLADELADALNSASRPRAPAGDSAPVYTKPIQPQPNAPTVNPLTAAMANLPPGSAILTVNSSFQPPNPMGGVNYYLMRDDFAATMTKHGYPLPAGADPKTVFSQPCAKPDQVDTCHRMILASKANPAAIKQSDPYGTAIIGPVQPGTYYLFIYSFGPGRISLYWDEKVTLTAGSNSFTVGMENSKPLR